ncbi:MAG: hypothetical protein IJ860_10375 [Eubacterium sp.]|nr:hypothetical protein [Eubacterium sp.]
MAKYKGMNKRHLKDIYDKFRGRQKENVARIIERNMTETAAQSFERTAAQGLAKAEMQGQARVPGILRRAIILSLIVIMSLEIPGGVRASGSGLM